MLPSDAGAQQLQVEQPERYLFGPFVCLVWWILSTTISIPHIGQASPFGQSLSNRDVFRLRLAPVDQMIQILTNGFHTLRGNLDDHFWDQISMRHTRQVWQTAFFFISQVLCYNNTPTMITVIHRHHHWMTHYHNSTSAEWICMNLFLPKSLIYSQFFDIFFIFFGEDSVQQEPCSFFPN